jgi:hypothetical protein
MGTEKRVILGMAELVKEVDNLASSCAQALGAGGLERVMVPREKTEGLHRISRRYACW